MSEQFITDVADFDPHSIPLEEIDPAQPHLFAADAHWGLFERLRNEDPVHYTPSGPHGAYWSVTRYEDIFTVDTNHGVFSSARGITLDRQAAPREPDREYTEEEIKAYEERREQQGPFSMFIAMDPPTHDEQRATVSPVVAPPNLKKLEGTIRERAANILDSLPRDETFNWVEKVSIELTTQMLATLFDFPFEQRRKLTLWSEIFTGGKGAAHLSEEERGAEIMGCLAQFTELFNQRRETPGEFDLITMLAHGESTKDLKPMEFLGNLVLLIVGGNDTTRNSISGGVLALNENPAEYEKLMANPKLIPNMVSEIIRWQTPLTHMRRIANQDFQLCDKTIKAGDRVIMWYVSGNRDERHIENPNQFIIDRQRAREHLSFGFGIHRCMGNRLAEMQIRVLWEEILKRFSKVEVVGEPKRTESIFIKGYTDLPVRVHPV